MPQTDPMIPLRAQASRTLATNAHLLETTPSSARPDPRKPGGTPLESLSTLPGGVGDAVDKFLKPRWPAARSAGERWAKGIARAHLKGVGPVGDAIDFATAQDKGRSAAGIGGAWVGGVLGGLAPPPVDLVTGPVGAAIGDLAGKAIYDRRRQIGDAIESEAATLADQWAQELKHYAPYDLPDRLMRR